MLASFATCERGVHTRFVAGAVAVAIAADDLYAMPLAVTARSVAETLDPARQLELFVLDAGIRSANRRRIEQSLEGMPVALQWVSPDATEVRRIARHNPIGYPPAAYYRLELASVLPERVTRVVYLDSDMVCVSDIGALFDLDLGAHQAAAVGEYYASSTRSGVLDDGVYFNTGVLLIDLDAWRRDGIGPRALAALDAQPERLLFPDQDALNLTLRDRIMRLDGRWNQLPDLLTGEPDDGLYSDGELQAIREDPFVIHYASKPKPWQGNCGHPRRDRWFDTVDRTAWRGWRPTPVALASGKARRVKRRALTQLSRWGAGS